MIASQMAIARREATGGELDEAVLPHLHRCTRHLEKVDHWDIEDLDAYDLWDRPTIVYKSVPQQLRYQGY